MTWEDEAIILRDARATGPTANGLMALESVVKGSLVWSLPSAAQLRRGYQTSDDAHPDSTDRG